MAGSEYLDPVVAVLGGDSVAYMAMLAEAEARMEAFVAATTVQIAELDASMAALGAGGAGEAGAAAAAAAEAGAAGGAGAATAAAAEQEAAAARVVAAEEAVAAAATDAVVAKEAAATQIAAADTTIAAGAQEAAAGEEAANTRIAESTADMTAAVEAEIARLAATPITIADAADTAATEYAAAMDKMRADTIALVTSLEAAEARATQATAAMGAELDTAAASSSSSLRSGAAAVGSAVAGVATAATVLGVAVGGVSIKMASDFQSSTNRLVTSAGESEQNIGMVRDGILQMAGEVGDSAEELSKAMYTVESGGQHAANGLQVLKAAAQGAKAEGADLGKVADAVTSILQDYHLQASDSALVTSKLVAAVGAGKSTFEEFTGALHSVLPVASASHISLNDILGDLASMTVHGMSADQAAQNLSHTIQHLQTTTQGQRDMLGELGISAQDLQSKLGERGLAGTLQLIESAISDHMGPAGKVVVDTFNKSKDAAAALQQMLQQMPSAVQALAQSYLNGSLSLADFAKQTKALPADQANLAKQFETTANRAEGFSTMLKQGQPDALAFADALKRATGDSTALNTALMLTGENADYTNNAIKTVTDATTEADGSVKGWADVQSTFNQRFAEFKDTLEAVGIKIGTALLPSLTDMLKHFDSLMGEKGSLDKFAAGVSNALQMIINAVTAVGTGFQGLTDIMQGITSGNLDQAKKGFGELANSFKDLGANMTDVTKAGANAVQGLAANMNTIHDSMNTYEQQWRSYFTQYYPEDIKAGIPPSQAASKAMNDAIIEQFLMSGDRLRVNGQMSTLDFSSGMRDSIGAVIDAAAGVTGDLKSAWELFDPSPEGKKAAESFGSGVKTGRQAVDAAGQEALTSLITIFASSGYLMKPEGNKAGEAFANGIASTLPQVDRSAGTLANGATAPFSGLPGASYGSGVSIGSMLAWGMASQQAHVAAAAAGLAATVRSHLPSSPAKTGPLSGRGSPDILGRNISAMIATGVMSGRGTVAQAMSAVLEAPSSGSYSSVFAQSGSGAAVRGGAGGGLTINVTVQGSLIHQQELRRFLQDLVLQHEGRNNSNGLSGVMV